MNVKNYKGRITKSTVPKVNGICKTYSPLQDAYVQILSKKEDIAEINCHFHLKGLMAEKQYTSDFVCKKRDGSLLVRETVLTSSLKRVNTAHLLELSQNYWAEKNVSDWGIVTDADE